MPKHWALPHFVKDGKLWVFNKVLNTVEEYNQKKHKYIRPEFLSKQNQIYYFEYKSGTFFEIYNIYEYGSKEVGTVISQNEKGLTVITSSGKIVDIPLDKVQSFLDRAQLNNLKITYNDPKSKLSTLTLNVPTYLKNFGLGENWEDYIKSEDATSDQLKQEESELESISKNDAINTSTNEANVAFEQSQPDNSDTDDSLDKIKNLMESLEEGPLTRMQKGIEQIADVHLNVTEDTKETVLPTLTYLTFYKMIVDNSHVGDILSLPVAILNDMRLELVKVLKSSFSGNSKTFIAKLNTENDESHKVMGILSFDTSDYAKFQIMNKPLDENSIGIGDIEVEYFKWKQSRKFV